MQIYRRKKKYILDDRFTKSGCFVPLRHACGENCHIRQARNLNRQVLFYCICRRFGKGYESGVEQFGVGYLKGCEYMIL